MKIKLLYLFLYFYHFLKLRSEAYTSTLGLLTHSLSETLICLHNILRNLAKEEKSYTGQTLTRFQAASHMANAPRRQQPDNSH